MSKKILVVNGASYAKAIEDLGPVTSYVDDFMERPEEFSLVMFTGGADVDPRFYGDTSPRNLCCSTPARDTHEMLIFNRALNAGVLMTGICRGVQFLNVACGGRMMHHIEDHAGTTHLMELATGGSIIVNSLHHQMVIPSKHSEIIGWSKNRRSAVYFGQGDREVLYEGPEVEAVIFPQHGAFGVQYHPEMMAKDSDGYQFYYRFVKDALEMGWQEFNLLYTKGNDNARSIAAEVP
jgi:putative glutamine amidotransferase